MQRTYVKLLLVSSLMAVLLGATTNYLVDPYGLFRIVDWNGFNRHKPKAGLSGGLVKPYNVQRVLPRTLLLGNSRVEAGLDPESSRWPAEARPVYNMAFRGTGIDAALKSLQHVISTAKPDMVVLGVDFTYFADNEQPANGKRAHPAELSEFDRRLLVNVDGSRNDFYRLQKVKDLAAALFSLNALLDSALTLALQSRSDQPDLTDKGFNPMREFERFARVDGYPTLFRQVETTYLTNYMRGPRVLYSNGGATSPKLEQLRDLVTICRAHGIRLLLYIDPYHAHMLESYRIANLWPLFEEWKRALVRILDADASAHPGAAPFDLWDFSGYNEITTESIPAASEKGRMMQWYWELGHYKRAVGDFILARMLGSSADAGPAPAAFGVKLDKRNIDRHLDEIRDARSRYADTHREEIAALETLAQSIRARAAGTKGAR